MKMAVAEGQNIERHHPRQHIMIRQRIAQHADVAGAVLKTDDHRILPSMVRDQVRDLCGVVALDRDEDDIRVRKNRRRIVGQFDLGRGQAMFDIFKARDLQPVPVDVLDQSRTGQQRDRVSGGAQHPPDEAADAAGACDRHGLQCAHIAAHSLFQPAGISPPVIFPVSRKSGNFIAPAASNAQV